MICYENPAIRLLGGAPKVLSFYLGISVSLQMLPTCARSKNSPMAPIESAVVGEICTKSRDVSSSQQVNPTDVLPPNETYEGYHRYDPSLVWTEEEERDVVRTTDTCLLLWLCLMVINPPSFSAPRALITNSWQFMGLSLDRSNFANAMTDNLLEDLSLTTDDYNNVRAWLLASTFAL